jgi:hypothetical protein
MATHEPRPGRRRGGAARAAAARPLHASALGSGLALIAFALAVGPLAPLWEGALLGHVRAALRGEHPPAVAFTGMLLPVILVALSLAAITTWAATRTSPRAAASRSREGGHADARRAGEARPWSPALLVAPLVLVLLAAHATRGWVFSIHAAAADPAPLLVALSHLLTALCGGLGVVLVLGSVVAARSRRGDRDDARRSST